VWDIVDNILCPRAAESVVETCVKDVMIFLLRKYIVYLQYDGCEGENKQENKEGYDVPVEYVCRID
jgi:hypothetical protein